MDANMMPKFSSKDEEIEYWKALSLKYKNRWVTDRARWTEESPPH